jgi:starch phosphorylase
MVREYVEKSYLPAARAYLRREAHGAELARELEEWYAKIDDQWPSVRFGRVHVDRAEDDWEFHVQAYLGDLSPDCVAVQLFADAVDGSVSTCVTMHREGRIHGAIGGYTYRARVPANRPAEHFTARVVPNHEAAYVPLEAVYSAWQR